MTYQTNPNKRNEIDAILKEVARLQSNTGKDSTKEELETCNRKQNKLLGFIKKIDLEFYNYVFYQSDNQIDKK